MKYSLLFSLLALLFGCQVASQPTEESVELTRKSDSVTAAIAQQDSLEVAFMEDYGLDEPANVPLNWEPTIDPATYPTLKKDAAGRLNALRKQYASAQTDSLRSDLKQQASDLLETTLTEQFFPCWYGTPWDFNGYTSVPNDGVIACGYFVSTPLLHAGFEVNRYKLAQQAAMQIIESLQGTPKVYTTLNNVEFAEEVAKMPEGLYVVGLDNHVGWIHHHEGEVYFIHSSYGTPSVVVRERASESEVLSWSSLYALGEVTTNMDLMEVWLADETVEIVYTK